MASIREIAGNIIGNHTAIIQGDFNTTINTGPSDTSDSFLSKISKTDPFYDKERILELKGPFLQESFSWFLEHKGFKKWRNTKQSGVLWIKGDPGKGKTMLLCGIINDLEKNPGINSNLGYFFCQATDSRINTAVSVVAGLIFSLIKRHPPLLSPVRKKYEDKLSQLNGPNAWAVLCDIFKAITQDAAISDPVCIVDALDECEHDCKLLLNLIVKTSTHVKWLLSSRNVKDIERGLRLIEPTRRLSLELKENAENVSESVDVYINHSIQDIEALEDDEELQTKTATTLKNKANGTFLWVALVVEQLRDTDRRNVEDVLEEIPEGLENLYDQIIQRANSKLRKRDREACQILLSIVTTAERPLHLEELHVFISSQWEHYKAAYDIRDMKDIVKDIGSLLSIRDDIVYFVHQSVKDYMVGVAAKNIFPLGIEHQHLKMVKTSLGAMSRTLNYDIYDLKEPRSHMDNIKPPNPDPLMPIAYCCVFWIEHLLRGGLEAEVLLKDDGILHSFLKAKYLCWLESLAFLRGFTPQIIDAFHKLKNLAASSCRSENNGHQASELMNPQGERDTNCLRTFIGDAYHFFHSCKDYIKEWPLQLYYSAIVFEDRYNAIFKTHEQSIRSHFGDFLAFIQKPRRRFSVLHNIDVRYFGKPLYSPNSSILCSLSRDTISLFRTDTGTLERAIKLNTYKNCCYYVAFSIDSRTLISISSTGVVQTWTIDSGARVQQLSLNLDVSEISVQNKYYHRPVLRLREEVINLSRHGDLAVSTRRTSSGSVSLVKIWTTKTGTCLCEIDLTHLTNVEDLHAVFSPNSALIALMQKNDVGIYSTQAGEEMKHIHHPRSTSIDKYKKCSKFSQDSELLALVYGNWSIYLWCTKTWTMIREIKAGARIRDFDLSPDASIFLVASDDILYFGSTGTGQQLLRIATKNSTNNASFSPDWLDSSLLASANFEALQIWRADTSDNSAEMLNADESVTISPGSKYVAARGLEGSIKTWSGESGELVQVLKIGDFDWSDQVFSPDLKLVACDQGDVRIWDLSTGEPLHLLESQSDWRGEVEMTFSDDSKSLVTAYSKKKEVRVWCVESGKCLFSSDENNDDDSNDDDSNDDDSNDDEVYHDFSAWVIAISPDSKYIARASIWTRYEADLGDLDVWKVHIWDWRAGHSLPSFEPRLSDGSYVRSLVFSSDATVLAVICQLDELWDGILTYEVQIWEVATGTRITCVAVGASYSWPVFDPTMNQILSDRHGFCKGDSWEHWDEISHRGYSLLQPPSDAPWICFGGKQIFRIPREFSLPSFGSVALSASLLAYATFADEIIIIQLPKQHELQRLGIKALDSDDNADIWSSDEDLVLAMLGIT